MTGIVPTQGRVVLYTLSSYDVSMIHKLRGRHFPANEVAEGLIFPAIIVQTWGSTPGSAVNLKVLLDGEDTYWATSRSVEPPSTIDGKPLRRPGHYHWMEYQKGQAAKNDDLVAKLLARVELLEAAITAAVPDAPPDVAPNFTEL